MSTFKRSVMRLQFIHARVLAVPPVKSLKWMPRGRLEAVGFISEEIATGHGCSLLQRRPSCCICCQIVNDI